MKSITISVVAAVAMSTLAFGGGGIAPVEQPVVEEVVTPASSGFYVGLGYSLATIGENGWYGEDYGQGEDYPEDIWSGEYEQDAITLIAGYDFNEYIGVEGRYMIGMGDAEWEDDVSGTFEEDISFTNVAIYLKPMLPMGDVTLYGLLGYGQTTYTWDASDAEDITASGFQYGAGVSVAVTKQISLFIDYVKFAEDDSQQTVIDDDPYFDYVTNVDGHAITFGATYKF